MAVRRRRIKAWIAAALILPLSPALSGCQDKGPTNLFGRNEKPKSSPRSKQDEAFEKASTTRPPTIKTQYATAKILANQGRNVECEQILATIIRDSPSFMAAYALMAQVQVRQRKLDEAVRTLRAGLAQSPNDGVLLNNLGMCRMMKADFQGALEAYTQAAAAEPDNARYRANMAAMLGMLGRYEEALSLYEQILSPADAHHNLAILHDARRSILSGEQSRQDRNRTLGDIGGFHQGPPSNTGSAATTQPTR